MAILVAGCAPLEWHKAGVSPEDLSNDQTHCTAQARTEAALHAPIRLPAQAVTDRQGRVIAVRPASPDSERFALEQDLIRRCMQARGYVLQNKTPSP